MIFMSIKENFTSSYIGNFIIHLTAFMPRKFAVTLTLMVTIGLSEGLGLLLLIPLLQLVGMDVQQGALGQISALISSLFNSLNINPTLGIVLIIYVLIISLNSFLFKLKTNESEEIEYKFSAHLRKNLFKSITYTNWLFFSKKRSSDLAHALTNEIERISLGTNQFLSLLSNSFILFIYFIFALKISGLIAGLVFLIGIILLILLRKKTSNTHLSGEELTAATKQMYSSALQHLDGMKTIKSFNMEEKNIIDFTKISDNVFKKYMGAINSYADVKFYFDVGSVVILSIIVFILIEFINISTAELLLLIFIFVRLVPLFSNIQYNYQYFINMIPAFASIIDLESECNNAAEPEIKNLKEDWDGDITFEKVSFSYDKTNESLEISDLNLKIHKGKTTALVGLSGAGKSTIADLIMGLIKPDTGQIIINNVTLTSESIMNWRSEIGYVAQDTFLFNDTIRCNLLFAKPEASEKEIKEVLKLASADEFVNKLPHGLDTFLGDRGVRLSGGERQRLALARALLRNPSILILDEATSNLDSNNEKKILNSIEKLHGNVTILMIAHRLSTIRNADFIYLIKDGRMVESGGWNDLLSSEKGYFKSLFENQDMR